MKSKELEDLRKALADYMYSEGCSCCRDNEKHKQASERLAQLLDIPKYEDESGYDFLQFKTKE